MSYDGSTKTVGELCTLVGSGTTPRGGSEVYVDTGVLFIRSQNVYSDGLRLDDVAHIPERIHREMRRSALRPYDVLYNITGASIGRCTYYPSGLGPANVNQHVCLLRIDDVEERDAVYLARVLDSDIGRRQMRALNAGSNREGLNYQQLKSFEVPWPSAATRHRIAEILDTIDETIQATERVIAKLRVARRGVVADLLRPGGDWLEASVGDVLLRIESGKSPDTPDSRPGAEEWGVLKVSAVHPAGFRPSESKVLRADQVRAQDEVRPGDVLITRANTPELVGMCCFVDSTPARRQLSDKTLRLVPASHVVPRFLALTLQSSSIRRQIERDGTGSSGSMKNISQAEIRALRASWPSVERQISITETVQALDSRLAGEAAVLSKLRSTREGLAGDLLSGRVRTVAA